MNTKPVPKRPRYILANGYEIDGEQDAKLRADTEAKIEQLRSAAASVCLDTIGGQIRQAELELKIAEKQLFLARKLPTAEPLPPSGAWEEPFRRACERAATEPVQLNPAPSLAVRMARAKLTALKLERLARRGRKGSGRR